MKGDQGTTTTPAAAGGRGHGVAPSNNGGGALFVLESKGNWKHAGFHLSTSIVAPALLSLAYAMTGLGWAPGILALLIGAAVSSYAYNLVSQTLEQAELEGHRLLRFRYVLGTMGPRTQVGVLSGGGGFVSAKARALSSAAPFWAARACR